MRPAQIGRVDSMQTGTFAAPPQPAPRRTGELSDIAEDEVCFNNLPSIPAGTQQASVEVLIRIRQTEK